MLGIEQRDLFESLFDQSGQAYTCNDASLEQEAIQEMQPDSAILVGILHYCIADTLQRKGKHLPSSITKVSLPSDQRQQIYADKNVGIGRMYHATGRETRVILEISPQQFSFTTVDRGRRMGHPPNSKEAFQEAIRHMSLFFETEILAPAPDNGYLYKYEGQWYKL